MITNDITNVVTMTAKTLSGTKVTINSFDVIIEPGLLPHSGRPLIMFFVKDENGQFGLFNQNELTDFVET
jgi:hypothetical protein